MSFKKSPKSLDCEVSEGLLALHYLFHLNSELIGQLISFSGSATQALKALDGFEPPAGVVCNADVWTGARQRRRQLKAYLKKVSRWCSQPGCHIVSSADDHFPARLKSTADPPLLLFCRGSVALLDQHAIALVGSRRATSAGMKTARMFAGDLCQQHLTVVSGMAKGIDAASHQGALDVEGNTIAILGTGCDVCYPKEHQSLYKKIAEQGLLVSELPLGAGPKKQHFPRRNRLISGLSLGVVVVEAAMRSGSLITARLALEQGREVFAVPGSIYSPLSRGPHQLLRQGAKLVEQTTHILEELPGTLVTELIYDFAESASVPADLVTSTANILACIGHDPVGLDDIIASSGEDVATIMGFLVEAEVMGLIEKTAFGYSRQIK